MPKRNALRPGLADDADQRVGLLPAVGDVVEAQRQVGAHVGMAVHGVQQLRDAGVGMLRLVGGVGHDDPRLGKLAVQAGEPARLGPLRRAGGQDDGEPLFLTVVEDRDVARIVAAQPHVHRRELDPNGAVPDPPLDTFQGLALGHADEVDAAEIAVAGAFLGHARGPAVVVVDSRQVGIEGLLLGGGPVRDVVGDGVEVGVQPHDGGKKDDVGVDDGRALARPDQLVDRPHGIGVGHADVGHELPRIRLGAEGVHVAVDEVHAVGSRGP